MTKAPDAFRTISEVADDLDLPQHVLRFWETRFTQIKPMKRGGGRRYYRPDDVHLLRGIRHMLYDEGYTIKGVQRILKDQGVRFVADSWQTDHPSSLIQSEMVENSQAEPVADPVPDEVILEMSEHRTEKTVAMPSAQPVTTIKEASQKPEISSPQVSARMAKQPERQSTEALSHLAESYAVVEPVYKPSLPSQPVLSSSSSAPPMVPFSISHNIPQHLVDAIMTTSSMVEIAPLATAEDEGVLPHDILADDQEGVKAPKARSLLDRFKAGHGNEEARSAHPLKLSTGDAKRLQDTLIDLLECKRLLDQIR